MTTKENPAPAASPIMSMKAIIVPAVSACSGSTKLKQKKQNILSSNDQIQGLVENMGTYSEFFFFLPDSLKWVALNVFNMMTSGQEHTLSFYFEAYLHQLE